MEMEEMKVLLRQGMEDGAFGMSSAPFYTPGSFSETEELIELARVVAEYGGIHESPEKGGVGGPGLRGHRTRGSPHAAVFL